MSDVQTRPSRRWLRTSITIIALCAAIVGLNALAVMWSSARTVLTAPAGEVIYAAGFDGFEDEWQQYEGRLSARIADGVLRLSVDDAPATIYSLARPNFADFDLHVQATTTGGPVDNAFGVIFRLEAASDACQMPLMILCDLAQAPLLSVPLRLLFRPHAGGAQGYYMFLISADGYYSVWQAVDDGSGTQARRVSAWIASDLVNQGLNAVNELRVLAVGDTFRFFINGQPVSLCLPDGPNAQSTYSAGQCIGGQMTDVWVNADYAVGQIGLVAQSTLSGGSGVVVEFDKLRIFSPAPSPEVQI
ncbi:hypothetical protein VZO05_02120 [Aggregatilineales bacterium SYSU G02658]